VEWKNDKLVTITSKRPVCVTFNTRNFCPDDTSPQHGDHSGSLGGDASTVPPLSPTTDLTKVSYNVVTTYRPGAWQQALQEAGITHLDPNLVHDIIHGSPIGNPLLDPILFTFITRNLPSANISPEYISELIAEEIAAGRMDGPSEVRLLVQ